MLDGQAGKGKTILPRQYALMTMHRPSNVDDKDIFTNLINLLLDEFSKEMPLLWPIHPTGDEPFDGV